MKGLDQTGYRHISKDDAVEVATAIGHFLNEENPALIECYCSAAAAEDGVAIDHLIAESEAVHDHLEDGATAWSAHLLGEDVVSTKVVQLTRERWITGRLWKIRRWEICHQSGQV